MNKINLIIKDQQWLQNIPDIVLWSENVFNVALSTLRNMEIEFDKPVIINLALSNNSEVQALNAEFRGMNKPTNVLSFANIDDLDFDKMVEESDNIELGDIIVALETLQSEAEHLEISLKNHFTHLLIHGILHLYGFDHQTDTEAEEMEDIEVDILRALNITNPYEEID